MRHVWPSDHSFDELFESPTFGTLDFGADDEWITELSDEQAGKLLGLTPEQVLEMQLRSALQVFPTDD